MQNCCISLLGLRNEVISGKQENSTVTARNTKLQKSFILFFPWFFGVSPRWLTKHKVIRNYFHESKWNIANYYVGFRKSMHLIMLWAPSQSSSSWNWYIGIFWDSPTVSCIFWVYLKAVKQWLTPSDFWKADSKSKI